MKAWLTFSLMAALLTATACGGGDDDGPEVDCSGDVPTFDEVSAFSGCVLCHDSALTGVDRQAAPVGVDFDTADAAMLWAEESVLQVHDGLMPPEGSGVTITEEQKQDLYTWGLCGTPI